MCESGTIFQSKKLILCSFSSIKLKLKIENLNVAQFLNYYNLKFKEEI